MSPKYHSLAFDEAVREFPSDQMDVAFEPDLKVIVNAHYIKASATPKTEIVQVKGSITVSF